ncbi:MAG: radical SAM protein [Planctomycetota bacterium]|jgi:radical SAM protein with 4Fe4S-binding SPASM domain
MNIQWDDFRKKFKLGEEQEIIIKYLLNRLKDHFAEMCECETIDYGLSPIEYFVDMRTNNMNLDNETLKKKFIDYYSQEKKLGSDLTYSKLFEDVCVSTSKEVVRLLNEEQIILFQSFKIRELPNIVTGYDPLADKVLQQIERSNIIKNRNSNTTCMIPFEFAYIDNTGNVYPCCPSKFKKSIGDLRNDSLKDIWNSKAAVAVRESIINKSFRYCDYQSCEYLKKDKITSNTDGEVPEDIKAILNSNSAMPKIMNLAYDRTCNLACPYCRTEIHNPKKNLNAANAPKIHANLFNQGVNGVERMIMSGNGDPFASQYYMDFLQNFDHKKYPDVRIKIQTNGLLLTPERWNSIAKSHGAIDWISVSIDAATEETYKLNRQGSFIKLLKNLEFISELRKSGKIDLFYINFVVQANNYKEIKLFIELGLKYRCDLIEFQCLENWGTYSSDEFKKVAIQYKSHPEHKEFLKVMDDPIFLNPTVSTLKLLEYLPDSIKKRMKIGNIIKYD